MDGKELSQVELLVEIVGEKINAQVAAHERYSQAFIRILDALETIIDSQDNISGGDTAYFKQLASDISEFNEKIKDQEAEDKVAKQKWKSEHPDDTMKSQERLYELGMIDSLPWETVEKFDEQRAEESKKKSSYMIKDQDQQVKKTKE